MNKKALENIKQHAKYLSDEFPSQAWVETIIELCDTVEELEATNADLLEALVDIVFSADGPKEYKNECHAQYWVSAPRIERAREAIQKAKA